MSVYTVLTKQEVEQLLQGYQLGEFCGFEGISDGVTNTIYKVTLGDKAYVLTIFEELTAEELPFFIDLMTCLTEHGLACPNVMYDHQQVAIQHIRDKPAMLCEFLPGNTLSVPTIAQCQQAGETLARLHNITAVSQLSQSNKYDLAWHDKLVKKLLPFLSDEQCQLLQSELFFQQQQDYSRLPQGVCHMDLFVDNVLFEGDKLTGILDLYFACSNYYLLDLAVAMCAWSLTDSGVQQMKAESLLSAYQLERPLVAEELLHLKSLQRYAALHFWMTRLRDKYLVDAVDTVQVKDPQQFQDLLHCLIAIDSDS